MYKQLSGTVELNSISLKVTWMRREEILYTVWATLHTQGTECEMRDMNLVFFQMVFVPSYFSLCDYIPVLSGIVALKKKFCFVHVTWQTISSDAHLRKWISGSK